MKIASLCRLLATRSHWVVHSVWLAVLAVVICANVIFDYFQIRTDDMRLLVSESGIAASIVKSDLAGVTALLNVVEGLVDGPGERDRPPWQSTSILLRTATPLWAA